MVKTENSSKIKQLEKRWTKELLEPGWTALPSIILEKQDALGLDTVDINIILQLVRHWWFSENLPYPSKKTIAKCIGKSPNTVQRHIAAMEKSGFIKRIDRYDVNSGRQSNIYDLGGLIKEATRFAVEASSLSKKQKEEKNERIMRKRPK